MRTAIDIADSSKPVDVASRGKQPGAMTILVPLDTYLPGYKAGGPIRSIANMVEALGDELSFRVITLDRDLGDQVPFPDITTNCWATEASARVMYLEPGLRGFMRTYAMFRSLDGNTVVYLNSVFGRRFSILPILMHYFKLCKPRCIVLAPRGGFSPGALGLKRLKKLLYLRISRWLGIYDNLIWHACNDLEKMNILNTFPGAIAADIATFMDGRISGGHRDRASLVVTAPEIAIARESRHDRPPKKAGQLRLLFVSRISRMKNLSGALQMLQGVSGNVTFDIYGPAEDAEYWEECQCLIAALPDTIRVQYHGALEHDQVAKVFREHELFLFPTLGEGYGHVIYESLAAGCPVLISDQTPWRNLQVEGAGQDIPLNEPDRFREALQSFVDLDTESYLAYSKNTTSYLNRRTSDPKTIEATRKLLQLAFSWGESAGLAGRR
jgi:glycosyltransferase involved in cell wall biosynthesis